MHIVDWIVLFGILASIVIYGLYKTREIKNAASYLVGNRDLKWWTIGLSVMATQASAITFLSTPGQAYEDGMRFAQFYIGLPIAMVILCIFVLPIYSKLKIVTAYEYLEKRFDYRVRAITALLFLVQRGLAAGITIYAPAIILSSILDWNLQITTLIIGLLVISYTVLGGSIAVSQTQKQQMIIILTGMFIALIVLIFKLPEDISLGETLQIAGKMGKMNIIDWEFDLSNKYNVWSGILGGTFLFLSYFGTDQSQVQRYIGGKSLTESRLGMLMNGLIKVPMQIAILFVGMMVFMFYQFNPSPLHFNNSNVQSIEQSELGDSYQQLEDKLIVLQDAKRKCITDLAAAIRNESSTQITLQEQLNLYDKQEQAIRTESKVLLETYGEQHQVKIDTQDSDYVFIRFVTEHLPVGLIGLLLAVIFAAAMSSTSAELNALSTCTISDFYRRRWRRGKSDKHYLNAAKITTALWGFIALLFAFYARLFENLIEAVNIIGSLFYGVILGVFALGFFFKNVGGKACLIAAIIGEIAILSMFYMESVGIIDLAYLWLNAIGCLLVIILGILIQFLNRKEN